MPRLEALLIGLFGVGTGALLGTWWAPDRVPDTTVEPMSLAPLLEEIRALRAQLERTTGAPRHSP